MLEVRLADAETCRRYRLMRELVLTEAARTGVPVRLIEEPEAEGILKYHTLNLPLLFIGREQIAAGNPPPREKVQNHLQTKRESR
jgi:hypothetical protein